MTAAIALGSTTERTPGLRRSNWLAAIVLVLTALLLMMGASVGSTGWESVLRMRDDPTSWQIVMDIRLPRSLGAWLAGALLGLAGAVAQGLFRNPLADPYLLGSASGATLGGALTMAWLGVSPSSAHWFARLGITGTAFLGAAGAVLLTLLLARVPLRHWLPH